MACKTETSSKQIHLSQPLHKNKIYTFDETHFPKYEQTLEFLGKKIASWPGRELFSIFRRNQYPTKKKTVLFRN